MRGKRAMCVETVGGLEGDYGGSGAYQRIEAVLYPIHRGILEFTGFEALEPFMAYGPSRVSGERRRASLEELRERIWGLEPARRR